MNIKQFLFLLVPAGIIIFCLYMAGIWGIVCFMLGGMTMTVIMFAINAGEENMISGMFWAVNEKVNKKDEKRK